MLTKLCIIVLAFLLLISNIYSQNAYSANEDIFHGVNTSILNLYQKFPIVAIGEGQHNSALTFEWLTTLINEIDFPEVVDNIVVEFGASEYQWVMDDFINNKDVPDSLFKKCWRETTQIMVWDNPIYENFFREIRNRNKDLPEQKRIRILLGDLSFGSEEGIGEHSFRIIEKEVLLKNQNALLIYGDLHFVRRDVFMNYAAASVLKKEDMNVIQFLEIYYPGKAFSIWGSVNTNDSLVNDVIDQENIQLPSFLHTSNSELGKLDFRVFYPFPTDYRTDNLGNDIEVSEHVQLPLKLITDGIIYRGSWESQNFIAPRPDNIYADTVYLNELIKREEVVNIPSYRTRLYFYKMIGSEDFSPFEVSLKNNSSKTIDILYQPIKIKIPEDKQMAVLIYTGYYYLSKQEVVQSIAVLSLAVREFPDEFHPYDILGDAFDANDEKEKAIDCYENALKIDPNNNITRKKLEILKNR